MPESSPSAPSSGSDVVSRAKRRFTRNSAFNAAGFLVQSVSAFIILPIVVHGLGNVQYGIWSLIGQSVASMDLLDFGMGVTVTRFLARHHARDERAEMQRLISTALAISFVPLLLVLLVGAVLTVGAPQWFHFPAALDAEVRTALVMITLSLAITFPGTVLNSAIPACSRYDIVSLRSMAWIIVRSFLYWLVLLEGWGLVGMAVVTLGTAIAAFSVGAYLSHRLIPGVWPSRDDVSGDTLRSLLGFSLWAFLMSISMRIIFDVDILVVGWRRGPLAVAFYAVAANLAERLRSSLKIVTTMMAPLATQIHALEQDEQLRLLFTVGSRLTVLLILPACLGMCLLGPEFLQLWVGPAYRAHSSGILILLTLTVLAFALAVCCTQVLYGMGRHRFNAVANLLEAGCNLGLSLLLAQRFGAMGVAWGTVIPAVGFEAIVLPYYTIRQIHLPVVRYLRQVILHPLLVGAPTVVWFWAWDRSGRVQGWSLFSAVVAAGVVIFATSLRLYGLQMVERLYLRRALARVPEQWLNLLLGPAPRPLASAA